MGGTSTNTAKATKAASQPAQNGVDIMCVATCFARSRGWVAGSPNLSRDNAGKNRSLGYVVGTRKKLQCIMRSLLLSVDR